jgi:hypothetical protein
MARKARTQEPAPLYEAVQSFASRWAEIHARADFPTGVVKKGTLVRADHPIVEAHRDLFMPARSDVGEGKRPGELLTPPEAA